MNIRPHHLLCIFGFKGHGYNKAFIDNLSKVIEKLKSNPDKLFNVVQKADEICFFCPHLKDALCQKEEDSERKVKEIDGRVAKALGVYPGTKISFSQLKQLLTKKDFYLPTLCEGCEWLKLGYCQRAISYEL